MGLLSRPLAWIVVGDWRYYVWMGVLTALCLLGLNAYAKQLVQGLLVMDMSDQVSWEVYIANFTFLVGSAAAGGDAGHSGLYSHSAGRNGGVSPHPQ